MLERAALEDSAGIQHRRNSLNARNLPVSDGPTCSWCTARDGSRSGSARRPQAWMARVARQPIPAALEGLVLRCLAKDPAARPASAEALIAELDDLRELGTWGREEARRWWRDEAPTIRRAIEAERSARSSAGPRTVAVDLKRRSRTFERMRTALK